MEQHFTMCDCFAEGLRVNYDPDDRSYYISLWYQGRREYAWVYRIRQALKVLRTGIPYEDQIIMSQDEMKRLCAWTDAMNKEMSHA